MHCDGWSPHLLRGCRWYNEGRGEVARSQDSAGRAGRRHTWVVSQCPEQLPQAMFQCRALGCFKVSLWALISFQTAGVLTNQAFHVSLSFALFCFAIDSGTPKRMERILSFSEAINDQQLTWLKWVLCLTSRILRWTVGRRPGKGMNYLCNFVVVYFAGCDFCSPVGSKAENVATLREGRWNVHLGMVGEGETLCFLLNCWSPHGVIS